MLPRVHHLLVTFSSSSRASYSTLKNLFNVNERLAKLNQQIWFLNQCASSGVLPPSIARMKFPEFMLHPRFTQDIKRIRTTVFSKMKRHVHAEQHINKSLSFKMIEDIEHAFDRETGNSIKQVRRTVYSLSSTHHHVRLQKRLSWLLKDPATLQQEEPIPIKDHTESTNLNTGGYPTIYPREELLTNSLDDVTTAPDVIEQASTHITTVQHTFQAPSQITVQPSAQAPSASEEAIQHTVQPPSQISVQLSAQASSASNGALPTQMHFYDVSTSADFSLSFSSLPHSLPPIPLSVPPTNPLNDHPTHPSSNPPFSDPPTNLNNLNLNNLTRFNNLLVTDLTNSLTHDEKALLTKGPKFAISEPINDKTKRNITVSFCRLANELRWKEHWLRNPTQKPQNSFPRYPYQDEIMQAPRYPDFERKLTRINEHITRCLKPINKKKAANLNHSERTILNNLKKKDLVFLPSDKGGEFCVLSRKQYTDLGMLHLNDSGIYKPVKSFSIKGLETRINNTWKKIAKSYNLTTYATKNFVSSNCDLAKFYFLIKTHKDSPVPKIRPIISNVNSPTTKLAWLLDKILKPLLKLVPAHLENTSELINRISALSRDTRSQFKYPISLDVVNLYNSIPPQRATEVVKQLIEENSARFTIMHHEDVADLLKVVLSNNFFTFNNLTFQQTQGLAMGSSVSAILAILYMNQVEKQALNVAGNYIGFYGRYVDDVCVLSRNANEATRIHEMFNRIDPHIKFEIEHPNDYSTLNLLDVAIKINSEGELFFDFYTKAAKKPIFVNYKSALPTCSKSHYINNERNRIKSRCSNAVSTNIHLAHFDSVLALNNYPSNFINSSKHRRKRRNNRNKPVSMSSSSASYFNIPFVNDVINNKIRAGFIKENLNVRLSHRTSSLRSALTSKPPNAPTCNKKDCALDNNLCFRRNVVYKITCNKCHKHYIGSTIRDLHTRIHEHFNLNNSSVYKHMQMCKNKDMTVSIIGSENRKGSLRIREALHIQEDKPEINSKEESKIDLILF